MELTQVITEYLDWLCEQPPEVIRQKYKEFRYPKDIDFEKTIGNTTYVVTSKFNQNASEDIINKVRRVILNEEIN